jgi:hypothetical protein
MLKAFFHWSDTHPASYWIIAAVPTATWLAWIARGLWRDPDQLRWKRWERILFAALLFGVLLAWRWPYLLSAQELGNPDESQLVAGAITLKHDPVFYRSVDGTTSGPLNFYALLPTHVLGVPLDYFNARLTGLLLLWGGFLATQALLAAFHGVALARLALVTGVTFLATVVDKDFIHYTSEHVSLLLIPLGWWLLWRHRRFSQSSRPPLGWLLAAVLAGLLPWAKLQSSLFGAALIAWSAWLLLHNPHLTRPGRIRHFGWMAGAAALPTLLALALLGATGQLEHFYRSYILENIAFVGGVDFPVTGILRHLAFICSFTWQFPVYLGVMAIVIVGGSAGLLFARRKPDAFWYLGLFLTLAACATILAPKRAHQHYLLYLIMPLTMWSGAIIGQLWHDMPKPNLASARRMVLFGLIIGVHVLIGWRMREGVPFMYGRFLEDWREPRTNISRMIREIAQPGDTLALWGWQPWIFVETGLPHGTRDSHTKSQLESERQKAYFRQRFLDDMARNKPTFFVDAVGHGGRAFAYHERGRQGYESFPELLAYVKQHYGSYHEEGSIRLMIRFNRHPHTAHLPPAP